MRHLSPLLIALICCACAPDDGDGLPLGQARRGLVLEVPGAFDTLSEAVRAARPGDTIRVGPGDFGADVTIEVADLTIEGPGPDRASLRRTINVRAAGFTLRDLALRADGAPFGLHLNGHGATLTARNVVVTGYHMGVLATDAAIDVEGVVAEGNRYGFYLTNAQGRIANATVVNNTHGGIVTRSGGRITVEHATIVGNGFSGTGDTAGGLALGPDGAEVVRNNIVVGNKDGVRCARCASALRRNDVWGNTTNYAGNDRRGQDDLSIDPRFVDPAQRDFRLRAGSPCLDAGLAGGPAADAVGAPRPAGAAPDLGAFEYQPPAARVLVNEVMANPVDEASGEFVELFNAGDAPVDLAGYRLDDGDAVDVLLAFGGGPTVLAPGGYAVVLDRDAGAGVPLPPGTVRLTVGDARLGNALAVGDPVSLLAPAGGVVSAYDAPFDPGNGVSAERHGERFVPSPCGASPGARNCAEAPPPAPAAALLITEVMANPLDEGTGEYVELLNLAERPVDLAGFTLSDGDADDVIEGFRGGPTVVPGGGGFALVVDRDYDGAYDVPEGVVLLTTAGDARLGNSLATSDPVTIRDRAGALVGSFSHPFDPGNGRSAELVALDAGDRDGSWVGSPCGASPGADNCAWEAGPEPPPSLRLSEVMANPANEDTGEFVEIENTGALPVDAAGLQLSDGDAVDVLRAFAPGGPTVIPPGGFAVVLDPEYRGEYALPAHAILLRPADTTLGSGLATSDPVEIRAADGTVVDAFPRPFDPGSGHSAERAADGRWVTSPCFRSPGWGNCVDRPLSSDPRSCEDDADCPLDLRCIGVPAGARFGRCADLDARPGEGDACAASGDCGADLVCAGLTVFPEDAFCLAAYHHGTYSSIPHAAIPDGGMAGATDTQRVYGLATVPIDVQVRLDITHPAPAQLLVTLESPTGGSAVVFDGARDAPERLRALLPAGPGIARDEAVNGDWTLRVVDRAAGGTGVLHAWVLNLIGNWD